MSAAAWRDTLEAIRGVLFGNPGEPADMSDVEAEIGRAIYDRLVFLGEAYERLGPQPNFLAESSEHTQWRARAVRTLETLDLIARRADEGPATPNISGDIAASEQTIRDRALAAMESPLVPEAERFLLRRANRVALPPEPALYVAAHYTPTHYARRKSGFPEEDIGGSTNGELALDLTAEITTALEWIDLIAASP